MFKADQVAAARLSSQLDAIDKVDANLGVLIGALVTLASLYTASAGFYSEGARTYRHQAARSRAPVGVTTNHGSATPSTRGHPEPPAIPERLTVGEATIARLTQQCLVGLTRVPESAYEPLGVPRAGGAAALNAAAPARCS